MIWSWSYVPAAVTQPNIVIYWPRYAEYSEGSSAEEIVVTPYVGPWSP